MLIDMPVMKVEEEYACHQAGRVYPLQLWAGVIEKVVSQRRKEGVTPIGEQKRKEWVRQAVGKNSFSHFLRMKPPPLSLHCTGCSTDPLPPVCSTRHKAAVMDQ